MVYVPLASLLAQSGLQLDIVTANAEVKQWLRQVANQLVHGTTYEQLPERMTKEVPPSACAAGAIAGAISLPQAAGCRRRRQRHPHHAGHRDGAYRRSSAYSP